MTRIIEREHETREVDFVGSSGSRIDGRDLFADSGLFPGSSCRLYITSEGPHGVLDVEVATISGHRHIGKSRLRPRCNMPVINSDNGTSRNSIEKFCF